MNTLIATKRSKTTKLADIRKSGSIPAVVYGARVENTSISVPSIAFEKVWKNAGESSTIVLDLEKKKIDVLIHEVQVDPVKSFPIHIDFLAVDMNKSIKVDITLEFIGIAPAEKNGLGVLVKVLHEVEIEALPKDIPHTLVVDVTTLETLENRIHVSDIKLPSGVKILTDKDEVVALVTAVQEEKEEVPVDLSAIEVEKKGKQEEEGGEGEVKETPEKENS
jgi:large subunit ribosomal protein L25